MPAWHATGGQEQFARGLPAFVTVSWDWHTSGFRWRFGLIPSYVTPEDGLQILASEFLVILGCLGVTLAPLRMILPSALKSGGLHL